MATTSGATRSRALRAACVAAVIAGVLLVPAIAMAATPSKPVLKDVYVSGTDWVTLEWTASTDRDGHELEYYIYRLPQPLNSTNSPVSATAIAGPIDGTSYVLDTTATNEAEETYVWYYAIRAREKSTTNRYYSTLSQTMAPNLHGFRELAPNAVTCTRCHSAHGTTSDPWTYRDLGLCYSCHAADTAGDRGAKSSYNIKADFKEYESQEATGSWHRSDKMTTDGTECDACHDPHVSPYWYENDGTQNQDKSYRKMLRVQTGPDTYAYYSTNTDSAESGAFCLACHGADAQPIGYVGDADAYAATAGDHNEDGYATAAHGISGATSVKSNDFTKTGTYSAAQFPQIQCLACHDKHASAADKLIAYRGEDLKVDGVSTYAQAELCFKCHSAAGSAAEKAAGTSVGGTNLAWNGRDVQWWFANKTSFHPTSASDEEPTPRPRTTTHTTVTDFGSYTLTSSVVDPSIGDGGIRLNANAPRFYTGWEDQSFTGWTRSNTARITAVTTGGPYAGTYHATMGGDGTQRTDLLTRSTAISTTGMTNPTLSFWWYTTALSANTDWLEVQVATNNAFTANLTTTRLVTGPSALRAYTQTTVNLPVSGTVYFRFRFARNNAAEDAYIDEVTVPSAGYVSPGTAVSPAVAPASLTSWTEIRGTQTTPSGTSVTYDVLNGATDAAIAGYTGRALPIDVSGISSASVPSLKVRAALTGGANSPAIESLTFAYVSMPEESGSVTCANCHNVHSVGTGGSEVWDMARASDPADTTNPAPSDPSTFCLRCHKTTDAEGRALVATSTATSLVPYTVKFTSPAAPFFPGWGKTEPGVAWSTSGHANSRVTRMTPGCNNCHDPHASAQSRLVAGTAVNALGTTLHDIRRDDTYAEETLCYLCHLAKRTAPNCTGGSCHPNIDSIGVGMNVQTAFSGTYRHPVGLSGRHTDLEDGGDSGLGKNNRHAECADCHDPHATKAGLHTQANSQAGNVLVGAFGVKPNYATPVFPDTGWGANNWTVAGSYDEIRLTGQATDFEAYLCLKCHSSYTTLPASVTRNTQTYTPTDVAREFNPSNFGEHNVLGQSTGSASSFTFVDSSGGTVTRTWTLPSAASVFTGTWGWNSQMTCTDCHVGDITSAKGPHGSTVPYMIDPNYLVPWEEARGDDPDVTGSQNTYSGATAATRTICAKCHNASYTGMNSVHAYTKHFRGEYSGGGRCISCHSRIPHGWKRPRLLTYTTDGPYASMSLRQLQSSSHGGWSDDNCGTTGCDTHGSTVTPYWP